MKFKWIIPVLLLAFCFSGKAQSFVGLTKLEVQERVRSDHKTFRKDNTVIRQQFNYLKYVNVTRTKTWILYFTDEDICKTSKLVCDYSEYDEVVEKLSTDYEKVGESRWEYTHDSEAFQVVLAKEEWYFTVRETRKE